MKKTVLLDENRKIYLHATGRMLWVQQGDYCLARAGEWGLQVLKVPQEQRASPSERIAKNFSAPLPLKSKWSIGWDFRAAVKNTHGVDIPEEYLSNVPSSVWSKDLN